MAMLKTDELNSFNAADFIRNYFKPMPITDKQKEEREDVSFDMRDALLFLFALINIFGDYDAIDWIAVEEQFRIEFSNAANKRAESDKWLEDYIFIKVSDLINITKEQDLDDPYWLSDERATMEAVNEANDIVGHNELRQAIKAGYKFKTWRGKMDAKERISHVKMEGKTVGITDYFYLDKGKMLYAHDWLNCPNECYNCRCATVYSKDGKNGY